MVDRKYILDCVAIVLRFVVIFEAGMLFAVWVWPGREVTVFQRTVVEIYLCPGDQLALAANLRL